MAAPIEKRKLDDAQVNSSLSVSSEEKKLKLDQNSHAHHPEWENFKDFTLVSVLSDDAHTKTMCLHAKATLKSGTECPYDTGDDKSTADAVIVLEKTAFDTTKPKTDKLLSSTTDLKLIFNNDIYGTYEGYPADNGVRTTIIFPATEKHLEKYKSHFGDVIYETGEDYRSLTLPWIETSSFDMRWIYNILEKKKESEFIIYEDPDPVNGFILIPDLKWDRKSLDNMYCSALVHRHGIRSIRDLTTEHLPLLKNLRDAGLKAIEDKYGVKKSKVRAYFHYQPSYFHLHVHYNQAKFNAPGSNVLNAHLLEDVIDNIEMVPDYYQRKTIPFVGKDNTTLYKLYKDAGRI